MDRYLVITQLYGGAVHNLHIVEASSKANAELSIKDRFGFIVEAVKLHDIKAPWAYFKR